MSDNNDNVIDFFKRSSKGMGAKGLENNSSGKFFKGFPYIKLAKDANGNYFNRESLTEYSKKVFYIVTVMRDCAPSVALYIYKVSQAALTDFLLEFKNNNSDGEIVDIDKYIPEDLA